MSVINQVLSDLEKRGVNALPDEAAVRAVPPVRKNRLSMALLVVAILALALVAAEQWRRSRVQPKTILPAAEGVQRGGGKSTGNSNAAQPHAGSDVPGAVLVGGSNVGAAKPVAASPAVVAHVQEIHDVSSAQERGQQNGNESYGPGMRLSFELGSIPLPSSLRAKPAADTVMQRSGKAALAPASAVSVPTASPKVLSSQGSRVIVELPTLSQHKSASAAESKAAVPVSAEIPVGGVDKQIKQASAQQQAENEFRRANGLMQQGHVSDALAAYEAALQLDAGHDIARQAMVGLLLESRRNADAEHVLQDGLKHNPKHGGFAMLLARLQVERDALSLALDTLQKTLPYADQQPDYQAFVAALLQRLNRHKEAITHYQTALQLSPGSGIWLMGLGISLQALQRNEEARDAFRHALEARTLNTELQGFVKQRLKDL